MKKIGIVTIVGYNNYGNRLQNYALQEILKKKGFEVETLKNNEFSNTKNMYLLRKIKNMKHKDDYDTNEERSKCFKNFNENIKITNKKVTPFKKDLDCDYVIVGSDQVWNPNHGRLKDVDLLIFTKPHKRIAFSASFGISELPQKYHEKVKNELIKFKAISVREDAGKKIVEDLTGRKDVEVLVDPTMLLSAEEWDKVSKRPKQLDDLKNDKYILNYFLGELSEERRKEIERVAQENDCEIINILDKNSPFYQTGPSEFLYLEKNAFLICTDSFHSCVFAILYNRPFVVFKREGKTVDMNSRIETLINKFNLKNREFTGIITEQNLQHDYTEAYEILEKERAKSMKFLKKALDIENI